jgi:pilus assembly protein CpaB
MNKHAIIPLLIGLVVGIVALKLGYDYLAKMKTQNGPDLGPVQKVVVANKNLILGTKLTDKDISVVFMPGKCIPEGTLKDPKEAIGKTLKMSLLAKMPVGLAMVGPGDGLEGVIPDGLRAVAVKVDEFTSVGGLLKPGVKVDVMGTFTFRKSGGGNVTISKTVLQNVEVRAVGQQFKPDAGLVETSGKAKIQARSVTLLVTTDQAEILQLAASSGTIRLAMRAAADDKSSITKGVTLNQLVATDNYGAESGTFENLFATGAKGKQGSTARTLNLDEPYLVEIINGKKTEQIYFAAPDSDKRVESGKEAKPGLESLQAQGE